MSDYEELRRRNVEENKRILAQLGLQNNPFAPKKVVKKAPKRKRESIPKPAAKKFIVTTAEDGEDKDLGSVYGERRRSSRIKGVPAKEITEEMKKAMMEADTEEKELREKRTAMRNRPMVYGPIPGVEVGTLWQTRMECNAAGVHRPTVAGIHPGPEGAYSIALSGGYEDDIDLGECFTYTGEGGRDLKGTVNKPKNLRTAPQSKDQCLSRGNEALVKSSQNGHPVRVIRGYKSPTEYAPEEGYRYDGLYIVEKHWYTTGMAGFGVYKFALRRVKDQAPPPWTYSDQDSTNDNEDKSDEETENKNDEDQKEPLDVKFKEETDINDNSARGVLTDAN